MKFTGYLLVSKPEFASQIGNAELDCSNTLVNGLRYSGVERDQWATIVIEFYARRLPAPIEARWTDIKDVNRHDFTGLTLVRELSVAQELLEWSNSKDARRPYELIAIHASLLDEVKGQAIDVDPQMVTILGFDVVSLGYWSGPARINR